LVTLLTKWARGLKWFGDDHRGAPLRLVFALGASAAREAIGRRAINTTPFFIKRRCLIDQVGMQKVIDD
jgi:hypothetical protein